MKFTLILASIALLAACGNTETPQKPGEATPPAPAEAGMDTSSVSPTKDDADMSAQNVEAVKAVYDGFAAGDIPAVLARFDGSIVWNEAENSPYADKNPYEGADEIATGLFARLGTEWDYFNAAPSDFLPSGDRVVTIGRYSAKHRETGKEMDIPFVHVWTLQDGKVTRFQQYTDTLTHTEVMTN